MDSLVDVSDGADGGKRHDGFPNTFSIVARSPHGASKKGTGSEVHLGVARKSRSREVLVPLFRTVPKTPQVRIAGWALVVLLYAAVGADVAGADRIELKESRADQRTFLVSGRLDVNGQLQTAAVSGKSVALKLEVEAGWSYQERRLPGAGRDAQAYRSLRKYDKANAKIQVAEQTSHPRLRDSVQLIVAEGEREGLRFFSPSGPLTSGELELLDTEADSLSALAMLPEESVEQGEEWKPVDWVLQFLTGIEAVEKSSLVCRLESVKAGVARVEFSGEITGGILGSASEITIKGHYLFDVADHYLSHMEVIQVEKRTVGAVSPGAVVTANSTFDRAPLENAGGLSDEAINGIPLESNPASLLVLLEPPEMNVKCYYERNWHLFHQGKQVAVLRLLDKGSLIAQCNISPINPAAPGKHVDENQFQADVQRALGADFGKIIQAEAIPTKDKTFVFRVTVTGEARQPQPDGTAQAIPMQWIYYLLAAPGGEQVVLVFTVEAELAERLGTQDVGMVLSLEFVPPPKPPVPLKTGR